MCVHVHIFFLSFRLLLLFLRRRLYFARNMSPLVSPFTHSPQHIYGCMWFAHSGIRAVLVALCVCVHAFTKTHTIIIYVKPRFTVFYRVVPLQSMPFVHTISFACESLFRVCVPMWLCACVCVYKFTSKRNAH